MSKTFIMNKNAKYLPLLLIIIVSNLVSPSILETKADFEAYYSTNSSDSLVAQSRILIPENASFPAVKTIKVWITAYSSTPEQTDETPFITASGTYVREGVAAANFLPFGTKFRIPELFEDQIFVIEDRMHSRFSDRIDIWFPEEEEAKIFGKKLSKIEIISENSLSYKAPVAAN